MLFALSFLIGYCLLVPSQAGAVGQAVHRISFLMFGQAAYLIPLLAAWAAWTNIKPPAAVHWRLDLIVQILLILSASSFFSIFGNMFYSVNFGGWIGLKLNPLFRRLFGNGLALFITAGLSLYLASFLVRLSLRALIVGSWHKIADDYRIWQEAREQLKNNAPKPAARPQLKPEPAEIKTRTEPKIINPAAPRTQPAAPKIVPKAADAGVSSQASKPPAAEKAVNFEYTLPPFDLLASTKTPLIEQTKDEHLANADLLTKTLADFDIPSKVIEIIPGPVVTRYDIELAPGIKVQSVAALSENLSLAMKSPSIRIVPIPEKSAVGVEVPNDKSAMVGLKGIVSDDSFSCSSSILTLALGRTTDGAPYVADLKPMPHLLIAGATGSGKSVGIHTLIVSILFKARPDEVKFMLIDPKRLEMPIYKGIPHLYDPRVTPDKVSIITQPKDAAESLKKLVRVMEKRYEKFAQFAVRNIEGYNEKMAETGGEKEFYIVVIIDELADLMLIASKEVEDSIQRLAQMARAVGIHLVLATQRPSVDVITGVIKANFPARIAFQTTSKVDSRVILDMIGAEDLLGKGDMLFFPPGESRPIRLQGAFVSVNEAERVVEFITKQSVPNHYENIAANAGGNGGAHEKGDESSDELLDALNLVLERKRVSQDLLKAHFGSSARATNILSILETKGFIHKPEGTNRWTIYFDKIEEYIVAANFPPTQGTPQ